MDKKTYAVGVLSIIATILIVANLMPVPVAQGQFSIKDRDYTLATTRGQKGGQTLYVIDNRTGQIANLTINAGRIEVIAVNTLTGLATPTTPAVPAGRR